jgi:hypothetical protein
VVCLRPERDRRVQSAFVKEVAYFLPDVPEGADRVQSNAVTVDERGLLYLTDRIRGLTIIERL